MAIPSLFQYEGQTFRVVPELKVNEKEFKQIPLDRYFVRNDSDKTLLEEYQKIGLYL
jgi:hypothetical protein